ncbi:hypothetical protein BS78_04G058800, partial [Paspalum vaginatum]
SRAAAFGLPRRCPCLAPRHRPLPHPASPPRARARAAAPRPGRASRRRRTCARAAARRPSWASRRRPRPCQGRRPASRPSLPPAPTPNPGPMPGLGGRGSRGSAAAPPRAPLLGSGAAATRPPTNIRQDLAAPRSRERWVMRRLSWWDCAARYEIWEALLDDSNYFLNSTN